MNKKRTAALLLSMVLLYTCFISPVLAGADAVLAGSTIITPGMPQALQADLLKEWMPIAKPEPLGHYNTFDIELNRTYPYEEIQDILLYCINRSPLVRLYDIGQSVDGRTLYAYEIGNADAPAIVYVGGVHAREVFNPLLLLKMTASFLNDYQWEKAETAAVLEKVRFVILPLANPDGYEAAQFGSTVLRDQSLFLAKADARENKGNANGVDLNRAFPSHTSGLLQDGLSLNPRHSDAPSLHNYSGEYLGSQPETRAMMALFDRFIPGSLFFADFHSAGRIMYAGKPHLSEVLNSRMRGLAASTAKTLRYTLLKQEAEETADGGDGSTTDYVAELVQGYTFNTQTGRLSPNGVSSLVLDNQSAPQYPGAAMTIETTPGALNGPTTPKQHMAEWDRADFYKWFFYQVPGMVTASK